MKYKLLAIILCLMSLWTEAQIDTAGNSFYQAYTKVLSVSCSKATCHDGSFEPDFRTLESAYYTLVYHPIIKNNFLHRFQYRVVPFDTTMSVLYQRLINCCFANVNDRMPLLKGNPLPRNEMANIR